jgi:DNA-binding beta-propeller fold protein YncE
MREWDKGAAVDQSARASSLKFKDGLRRRDRHTPNQEALMKHISLLVALLLTWATPAMAYHVAHEIKLPGSDGWDYLTFDAKRQRLFVSHGTHVDVLDVSKGTVAGTIADTPGVHGIALADDLGRGYVSAGAAGIVVVFDLESLARVAEIKVTGDNPDAILYEPTTHRIFTFNGRGRNITAIDARKNEVVGTIAVDAKPEFAVADGTGHIFVNLEDKNSIAELDAKTLKVLATHALSGCEEPSGLAIDRAHHRLFSVCSNKVMDIVDSKSGRQVAQLPIGEGVDGAGFDSTAQLAFASAGEGVLTVVKEETPDKFTVIEMVPTKRGARTMTLDERTQQVFLSTAQRAPAPPAAAGQPRQRPAILPDTFEVLVLER